MSVRSSFLRTEREGKLPPLKVPPGPGPPPPRPVPASGLCTHWSCPSDALPAPEPVVSQGPHYLKEAPRGGSILISSPSKHRELVIIFLSLGMTRLLYEDANAPREGLLCCSPFCAVTTAPHGGWPALCSPSRGPPAPQSRPAASGRAGRSALPGAL